MLYKQERKVILTLDEQDINTLKVIGHLSREALTKISVKDTQIRVRNETAERSAIQKMLSEIIEGLK